VSNLKPIGPDTTKGLTRILKAAGGTMTDGRFTPAADALARQQRERGDREVQIALEIIKLIPRDQEPIDRYLDDLEQVYQWVTTDTWPASKSED
jgi:hypothetical protein